MAAPIGKHLIPRKKCSTISSEQQLDTNQSRVEDFFKPDKSHKVSDFCHEQKDRNGSPSGPRDTVISLHATYDEDIEGTVEGQSDSELPFSNSQISLLKKVISDSIEQKLRDFQQPILDDSMDEVSEHVSRSSTRERSQRQKSPSRSPSPVRPLVHNIDDTISDQDSQEDIDPDSLNLPLSSQLDTLSKIFPEEIKPMVPSKSAIRRPDMRERDPTISSLPLHASIRAKIDNAHLQLSTSSSRLLSREESVLSSGRFPDSTPFKRTRYTPSDFQDFASTYKVDKQCEELASSSTSNIFKNWCIDLHLSSKIANENKRSLCHDSFATWFADAAYESVRKVYEGIKDRSLSKDEVLTSLQESMNLICTSMNSTHFSADHSMKALVFNTLAQRDVFLHKFDKDLSKSQRDNLRAAPFNTPLLFAGETEKALESLQKAKQTKDRNINISFRPQDFSQSRESDKSTQRVLKPWERRPARSQANKTNSNQKPDKRHRPAPYKKPEWRQESKRGRGRGRPRYWVTSESWDSLPRNPFFFPITSDTCRGTSSGFLGNMGTNGGRSLGGFNHQIWLCFRIH